MIFDFPKWWASPTYDGFKSHANVTEGLNFFVENKIYQTKAAFLTSIFLIPGATTFTTFAQVSSSMYAALFGITQDPSGNPFLVTNLLPLSLGCTFVPFARNITVPLTPAALPTWRTVIENLESLQFLS